MQDRPSKVIVVPGSMHMDTLPSLQPENTYRYMLNGQHKSPDGRGYGRSREQSTEVVYTFQDDVFLIQEYYQDEKDRFIVFLYYPKKDVSEVGYLDLVSGTYTAMLDDSKWTNKFKFNCNTVINVEIKPLKQRSGCFHDILYFSSNYVSYKINIDGDHCNLNYEDILLFVGGCVPEIQVTRIPNGGDGHKCGIIQYFAALVDDTSNRSNFFGASEPIRLFSENNIQGEISDDAVKINIPGHKTNYSHILIVCAINVSGVPTYHELVTLPYNGNDIEYMHYGSESLIAIDEVEVNTFRSGFFRNKGLRAKDNRLILYELIPDFSPNLEEMVEDAEVFWLQAEIPAEMAAFIPTLPRNELLSLGAVINYADGTHSEVAHIYGRSASKKDLERVKTGDERNCTFCDVSRWRVENTAFITDTYCVSQAPFVVGASSQALQSQLEAAGAEFTQEVSTDNGNVRFYKLEPQQSYWEKIKDVPIGCITPPIDPDEYYGKLKALIEECGGCAPTIDFEKLFGLKKNPCKGCNGGCGSSNCNGGCGGGNCSGGGCGGSSDSTGNESETEGQSACAVTVTYYKAPFNCSPCNTFTGYGTFQDLQNILGPDYAVTTNIVTGQTPCGFYPCIEVDCGGDLRYIDYKNFETPNTVQDTLYGLCACGNNSGTGGREDASKSSCPGKGKNCTGCTKNCGHASGNALCNECMDSETGHAYGGVVSTGKYVCESCGQDSETPTCSCGGVASFCTTCGGSYYRLVLKAPETVSATMEEAGFTTEEMTLLKDCPTGEPIYDEKGCRIIGYKPVIVKRGRMGYWESEEDYPDFRNCDDDYYYSGVKEKIRHHLLPDESLVPYHISSQRGVRNPAQPDNIEHGNTKVYLLGLDIRGLKLPKNLPKPVCEENPISIVCQPIGGRINAKGMLTHTFLGQRDNEKFVVPKNGTNSLELFNRTIDVGLAQGDVPVQHFRGGGLHGLPIYNFHSPDTNFRRIPLRADRAHIPWEIFGPGYRYGIGAEGKHLGKMANAALNYRGYRGAVNLNRYKISKREIKPAVCPLFIKVIVHQTCCNSDDSGRGLATLYASFGFDINPSIIDTVELQGSIVNIVSNGSQSVFTYTGDQIAAMPDRLVRFTVHDHCDYGQDLSFDWYVKFTLKDGCRYDTGLIETKGNSRDGGTEPTTCFVEKKVEVSSLDYIPPEYEDLGAYRCIKDISYVGTDKILDKQGDFTYALDNSYREKSVYVEFEGSQLVLDNAVDPKLTDGLYNGARFMNIRADRSCDESFLGDIRCHHCEIKQAAAHYCVFINDNPKQYGRLEDAAYIKLGMEVNKEEYHLRQIKRIGIGNRWIGLYAHRRFGYVSDKIGRDIDQIYPLAGTALLDAVSLNLHWLLCAYTCSKLPLSCNSEEDTRKQYGLRDVGERCASSLFEWAGFTNRDTYWPNTYNQVNYFWVESEVNLWKRQTGTCEPMTILAEDSAIQKNIAEVDAINTKCLALDPDFPKGSDWLKSFLSRYGMLWPRASSLKRAIRILLKILITFVVGSLVYNMFDIGDIPLIGGILKAIIMGVFFALLLFVDSAFNIPVCQLLDRVLDVDECVFECYSDNNCKEEDSKLMLIEENYTKYNWILSFMNKLRYYFAPGPSYDTCICEEPINLQVYSDAQDLQNPQDSWQNFRSNNYSQLDLKYGLITDLFEWGSDLYAQTSTQVLRLYSYQDTLITGNGKEIILGTGNFLNRATPITAGIPEGWCGSVDTYASKSCKYGRIIIDRKDGIVFLFNGRPIPVATSGITEELKEQLPLKITEAFPKFKHVGFQENFIGYSVGYDPRYNRLLVTKIDYYPIEKEKIRYEKKMFFYIKGKERVPIKLTDTNYFENRSFTFSVDLENNSIIGYHSYIPSKYFNDRAFLYGFQGNKVYRHSTAKSFGNYYGQAGEWIVDVIIRDKSFTPFMFSKLTVDCESHYYIDGLPVKADQFFTHIGSWNSYQSTAKMVPIEIVTGSPNMAKRTGQIVKDKSVYVTGKLENRVEDEYETQILVKPKNLPSVLHDLNTLIHKEKGVRVPDFYDKYQGIRLICEASVDSNINIVLKFVTVDVSIPT